MKPARIKDISILLFRELIRDKVFLSLSGAAVLLVFASLILNEMVVGQEIKATRDLGLTVLNLFPLFILIFLGVNLVSRDLGNRSLYLLFSRPVRRSEYLVGSSISILMVILSGILVIGGTVFFLSVIHGESWLPGLVVAGYLSLLEMTVLLSFAYFFALIASPQLAMFLTLLMYVIGHTLEPAVRIVKDSTNVALKYTVIVLHTVLPNLEFFNKKPEIVYGVPLPSAFYLNSALYALAYTVLMMVLCGFVLKRKEL